MQPGAREALRRGTSRARAVRQTSSRERAHGPADPHLRTHRGGRAADGTIDLDPSLAYRRLAIVNVVLCGPCDAGDRGWVLIDAGAAGSRATIEQAAARFARPAAIVLTHGHFDHVGALEELAEAWDVPVHAHPLGVSTSMALTRRPIPRSPTG